MCSKPTKKETNYDYCPYEKQEIKIANKEPVNIDTDTSSLYDSSRTWSINISRWQSTKLDEKSMIDKSLILPANVSSNYFHRQFSSTIREQTDRLINKGYYNLTFQHTECTAISHKSSYLQLSSQVDDIDDKYETEEFHTEYNSISQTVGRYNDETTSFPSSIVTNSTNTSDNDESLSDSLSTTASQDDFDSTDQYVCILDYKPKLEGDIAIKYSDKIKVVNGRNGVTSNNNYVFVQLLKNRKYGYVPKKCFISLTQYLNF